MCCQLAASLQTSMEGGDSALAGGGQVVNTIISSVCSAMFPNRQDLLAAWPREVWKASWMEMPDSRFALVSSFYPEALIASLQSVV